MAYNLYPTGTCFDDALELLQKLALETPRWKWNDEICLVHALCVGGDGELFAHAWVEQKGAVWHSGILNGEKGYAQINRDEYYKEMGAQEITRYTIRQAALENKRTMNFGPWKKKYFVKTRTYHRNPEMELPVYLRDEP